MSYWKKAPFGNIPDLRAHWPIDQDRWDPWAGDESSSLDEDYQNALHSQKGLQSYLQKAIQNGLSLKPIHDYTLLQKANYCYPEEFLAAITEDWVPDIGIFAEERVLGPFAPRHQLRKLCGAILSFSALLRHNGTPAGQFGDLRNVSHKIALGIQAKTPAMLWQQDNGQITPILPIERQYKPGNTPIHHTPPHQYFIARMVRQRDGFHASCVLPLPCIAPEYTRTRIHLEWLRLQYYNKHLYWEDVLRYRSELLYRSCLEYCFVYHKEETLRCWDSYFSPVMEASLPPSPQP